MFLQLNAAAQKQSKIRITRMNLKIFKKFQ